MLQNSKGLKIVKLKKKKNPKKLKNYKKKVIKRLQRSQIKMKKVLVMRYGYRKKLNLGRGIKTIRKTRKGREI
jgi:hypothetical protein